MILPMYIFGQPVLRKTAEEIDFKSYPNLKELIDNMFETLRRSEGVGLAAPQRAIFTLSSILKLWK